MSCRAEPAANERRVWGPGWPIRRPKLDRKRMYDNMLCGPEPAPGTHPQHSYFHCCNSLHPDCSAWYFDNTRLLLSSIFGQSSLRDWKYPMLCLAASGSILVQPRYFWHRKKFRRDSWLALKTQKWKLKWCFTEELRRTLDHLNLSWG